MVDFTNCEINNYKYYGGKNGGKICIKYNIDNTPYISDIRKQFYKKILKLRYDEILKVNYNKLS